jgi:hypothetical protein
MEADVGMIRDRACRLVDKLVALDFIDLFTVVNLTFVQVYCVDVLFYPIDFWVSTKTTKEAPFARRASSLGVIYF